MNHREQVKWLDAQPGQWWKDVCVRIAEGGESTEEGAKSNTLDAIRKEYGLFWGPLRTWIGEDAVREREYQDALAHCAEGSQQKATAAVMRVVGKVHEESTIEPSHSLRAAELVLGSRTVHEHRFDADRQSEEQILASARALIEATPGLLDQLIALVGRDKAAPLASLTYTRSASVEDAAPAGEEEPWKGI